MAPAPLPLLASLCVAMKTPTVPTGNDRTAARSAECTVTVGSLKSLTTVVLYRSPSPENFCRLPPESIWIDVTPVIGIGAPFAGVKVTPVQFMNRLAEDIGSYPIKNSGRGP